MKLSGNINVICSKSFFNKISRKINTVDHLSKHLAKGTSKNALKAYPIQV